MIHELFIRTLLLSLLSVFVIKTINTHFGIIGIDINKKSKPAVPESGGIALLIPIWAGILSLNMIYFNPDFFKLGFLITLFAFVGYVDDLTKKKKFLSQSLSWKVRAVPILMIAGIFSWLSFAGIEIILIMAFVICLASLENTFAGLNGYEVGSGLIISLFTAFLMIHTLLFPLNFVVSASILGLFLFNHYPARVFPGDSGTLLIGSAIAGLAALTHDFRLIATILLFFIPHMIDLGIKFYSERQDMSEQKIKPYKILEDGRLAIPDYEGKPRLNLPKFLLQFIGPKKEWQLSITMWLIVAANCSIVLFLMGWLK